MVNHIIRQPGVAEAMMHTPLMRAMACVLIILQIVYSRALRSIYPDVPIIAGGIEASLRRVSHYDYWQDCLRPSIWLTLMST